MNKKLIISFALVALVAVLGGYAVGHHSVQGGLDNIGGQVSSGNGLSSSGSQTISGFWIFNASPRGFSVTNNASVSGSFQVTGQIKTYSPEVIIASGSGGPTMIKTGESIYTTANTWFDAVNCQNTSTGTNASCDSSWTANDGTATSKFLTTGINNSKFSSSSFSGWLPHDGYSYTDVGSLRLGTASTSGGVFIFTGGTTTSQNRLSVLNTGVSVSLPFEVTGTYSSASQGFFQNDVIAGTNVASSSTIYTAEFASTGTTSINFGGSSATLGTCLQMKNTLGSTVYVRVVGTTLTVTTKKCHL